MSIISTRKILLSILSGIMLTASFPPGNLEWLAWFALVPLLKGLEGESPSGGFRLGFIAGLSHFLTLTYWIVSVLGTYGGLNIIISAGVLLLFCIYLSLYPALFSLLIHYLKGARFRAFLTAGVWISLEYLRANLLTGFPWCLLGYTQFRHPLLIQIVDTVGVYGVSFLLMSANAVIYLLLFKDGTKARHRFLALEILILLLLGGITAFYGNYRLSDHGSIPGKRDFFKASIIQGNIDQSVKWDPAYQKKTMATYRELSRISYSFKPDLIVWPETAVPFFFQENSELSGEVYRIALESGAEMIFGSPAYVKEGGIEKYYNRAYHLSARGVLTGAYDKVHLVPFGEYVPLKKLLPFVHRLVPAAGDFASGERVEPLQLTDLPTGVLICYEAIFPELSRIHVQNGARILVNLTNDAWFGMTSAPYQHLVMSVFRAVENRRPLIRAANTGFSAFIDENGRILLKGDLLSEEVLTKEIRTGDESLTIYTRHGDLFALMILIICLINFLYKLCYHLFFKSRRREREILTG